MGWQGAVIGAGIPLGLGVFHIVAGSGIMRREDRNIGRGFDAKAWGHGYEQKVSGLLMASLLAFGGGALGHQVQELYEIVDQASITDHGSSCSLFHSESCDFFGN